MGRTTGRPTDPSSGPSSFSATPANYTLLTNTTNKHYKAKQL